MENSDIERGAGTTNPPSRQRVSTHNQRMPLPDWELSSSSKSTRFGFSSLSKSRKDFQVDNRVIQSRIKKLAKKCKGADPSREHLERGLEHAGAHAYGVVGIEVWVLDDDDGRLKSPPGGFWASPLLATTETASSDKTEARERLLNPKHPLYCPTAPELPGVGLAGELWARARDPSMSSKKSPLVSLTGFDKLSSSAKGRPFFDQDMVMAALSADLQRSYHHNGRTLVWRDLKTLWIDPDTPKSDDRLQVFLQAGIGQAAAVPFSEHGTQGLVIFLARASANPSILLAAENQEFLFRQGKVIGSILSTDVAKRALAAAKRRSVRAAWRQFVHNLIQHKRELDGKLQGDDDLDSKPQHISKQESFAHSSMTNLRKTSIAAKQKLKKVVRKWLGGDAQVPPPLNANQSLWTLLGAFLGLLLLSGCNEYIIKFSDGRYELIMGPFGALVTLLYGLHSAPASQPRNVVLGQLVAGAVSLSFTYIPETILPVWIRRAVGPAFGISAMVKCGVTHPPAGAHAVIYASGNYGWKFYCFVVFGSMISILPAVLVNNLSERRQYPIYWGYWTRWLKTRMSRKGKKK